MDTLQHIEGGGGGEGEAKAVGSPLVVAFRCPPALKKLLRLKAIESDTTSQAVCVEALRRYLDWKETAA